MEQVDSALVVDVVRGEVLEADLPIDARAGPTDARDDVSTGHDRIGHVRPDLLDDAEVLVADDQEVGARRGCTVLGGVDLLVRAVDADAEDANEHAPVLRDVLDRRLRNVFEMDRAGLAGRDRDRLHGAIVSPFEAPLQSGA